MFFSSLLCLLLFYGQNRIFATVDRNIHIILENSLTVKPNVFHRHIRIFRCRDHIGNRYADTFISILGNDFLVGINAHVFHADIPNCGIMRLPFVRKITASRVQKSVSFAEPLIGYRQKLRDTDGIFFLVNLFGTSLKLFFRIKGLQFNRNINLRRGYPPTLGF